MKQPDKLYDYLVKLALYENKDPQDIIVPGLYGAPVTAKLHFPGGLSKKQQEYMSKGASPIVSGVSGKSAVSSVTAKAKTDDEVIEEITSRFNTLNELASAACMGKKMRGLILSGAGGVGKSYSVERTIEHFKEKDNIKAEFRKGMISTIELFMLLQRNKEKGAIAVLDDADGIFKNEDALSLLKGAIDTSDKRILSWNTNTPILDANGMEKKFVYEGTMIFISNLNFYEIVERGKGPIVAHMNALLTRAFYLDLKLHTERELSLWIRHMIKKHHILVQHNLTHTQEDEVLDFMMENKDNFNSLSLRTAILLAQCIEITPNKWKETAYNTVLKNIPKKLTTEDIIKSA